MLTDTNKSDIKDIFRAKRWREGGTVKRRRSFFKGAAMVDYAKLVARHLGATMSEIGDDVIFGPRGAEVRDLLD